MAASETPTVIGRWTNAIRTAKSILAWPKRDELAEDSAARTLAYEFLTIERELHTTQLDLAKLHIERARMATQIEFGRYLANAAEQYADVMATTAADVYEVTDKFKGLKSAIYEFRKRLPTLCSFSQRMVSVNWR